MKVKLKSNGRVGSVLMVANGRGYSTVVFPAQGNECSNTKNKGIIQVVHHTKLEDHKEV